MKKILSVFLIIIMMLALFGCSEQSNLESESEPESDTIADDSNLTFTPGTYSHEAIGMQGPIIVEVTLDETSIVDAKVVSSMETPGIGLIAGDMIAEQIVEFQSLDIDMVSGATITSAVVKNSIAACIKDSGGDTEALSKPRERNITEEIEYSADVVIVGGGGAGLSAASAALREGASVILIEKTGIIGGNSLVAGGFMNTPIPEMQDYHFPERQPSVDGLIESAIAEEPVSEEHKALQDAVAEEYAAYLETDKTLFDSANWFALQTWNGGDKLGSLPVVKKLAENSYGSMQWLIENGMSFQDKITMGGGALYTRSRYAVEPNGVGYISTLSDIIEKSANDNYTLLLNTEGKEIIMDGDKAVGVKALSIKTGKEITINANKGVILTTGGFAGNVDLRVEYCQGEKWPDLGSGVGTTNMVGVTGDGIFMAEKAGAELVNMEQIQLLPYCNPQTGQLNDVLGGADDSVVFINKEGSRFVREDGRRDEMSKAIIDQTDGIMYIFANAEGYGVDNLLDIKTLGGQSVSYFLDNNLNGIVIGDTLEDIANQLGFPVENLKETLESYNSHVDAGTEDEFGRVSFGVKLDEGPFIAYPRKPSAHHTMGGVSIDPQAHVLRSDGSIIEGLYCAGEITGVVHGANRIGGNAIVDYLTFGREAGYNAANGK